jgi:hypothetical protein
MKAGLKSKDRNQFLVNRREAIRLNAQEVKLPRKQGICDEQKTND